MRKEKKRRNSKENEKEADAVIPAIRELNVIKQIWTLAFLQCYPLPLIPSLSYCFHSIRPLAKGKRSPGGRLLYLMRLSIYDLKCLTNGHFQDFGLCGARELRTVDLNSSKFFSFYTTFLSELSFFFFRHSLPISHDPPLPPPQNLFHLHYLLSFSLDD